jgi:hypothetical protein
MTEAELPKLLNELEQATNRLNAESNSINTIIESVEMRVCAANPGIECALADRLKTEDEDRLIEAANLGFGKSGGTWGLFLYNLSREGGLAAKLAIEIGDDNRPKPVRLAQASRALRMAALRELPRLIEVLTKKVKQNIQAIEDAKRLVF